jgi:hypothetical protein
MRVEKFDDELIAALRTLGCEIAADKETAEIDVCISIKHPAHREDLSLEIQLPNRRHLRFDVTRKKIIDLAEEEA